MPFTSLDPSMLLAFLCRDEVEWKDLRARITSVRAFSYISFLLQSPITILPSVSLSQLGRFSPFSIQDEHTTYGDDSDSDVGMQSISEPGSDLSSDEHTFESNSGDMFELSDTTPDLQDESSMLAELNIKTPSQASQSGNFFPFPSEGGPSEEDDDDDWVTPTPQPPAQPRRTHLRSQSLVAPTIRPNALSTTSPLPSRS